jgi:hypothetical protein
MGHSRTRGSKPVDVDDGLSEGLRSFLRQIVTDAAVMILCAYRPENFFA